MINYIIVEQEADINTLIQELRKIESHFPYESVELLTSRIISMERIREEFPNAPFFLFSDDIRYLKENFAREDCTIVDINHDQESFYDIWLMSQCKHNICANSTFSFWGARLNSHEDKIMIRPTIHKNSQIFRKEEMEDLWPGWSFISPEGKLQ